MTDSNTRSPRTDSGSDTDEHSFGLVDGMQTASDAVEAVTTAEHQVIVNESAAFLVAISKDGKTKGSWMLITGSLLDVDGVTPEERVMRACIRAFGYPPLPEERRQTINLLLDSGGGSLDSAFKITMYLTRYARKLNVYVPRRAKSASTLIALGGRRIFLSSFGELGPLDTQIPDPRDPRKLTSALDCYQSVDYVRKFGIDTMFQVVDAMPRGLPSLDQFDKASQFAQGAISEMLKGVKAIDFGGWGRSLKIGEEYARLLMKVRGLDDDRSAEIARRLVYGYTHHRFPIDHDEAARIGLEVEWMPNNALEACDAILEACGDKSFIGFISPHEARNDIKEERIERAEARFKTIARTASVTAEETDVRSAETHLKDVLQAFEEEAHLPAGEPDRTHRGGEQDRVNASIDDMDQRYRRKLGLGAQGKSDATSTTASTATRRARTTTSVTATPE